MRKVFAALVTLTIFCALLYPAFRADLIVTRELFRAAESTGILSVGPNFWGQIAGRNIPLHSPAFHFAIRFISITFVFAVVLPICFAAPVFLGLGDPRRRATLCGRCSAVLKDLKTPRCPQCGESL